MFLGEKWRVRLPEDEAPHPGQTHEEVRDQSCGARFHEAGSSCHTYTHRLELPQSLTTQKHTHRQLYTWTTSAGRYPILQKQMQTVGSRPRPALARMTARAMFLSEADHL